MSLVATRKALSAELADSSSAVRGKNAPAEETAWAMLAAADAVSPLSALQLAARGEI